MIDEVLITKLKNKISSAIKSRSFDIKLSLEEADKLISELLKLSVTISNLQEEIIELNSSQGVEFNGGNLSQ